MKKVIIIKKLLISVRRYIQRSMSYVAIVNSVLIVLIFLGNNGINVNLATTGILIIIGTLGIMFIFGFIEDKVFNLVEEDNRWGAERNPILMKMYRDIKDIKEGLNKKHGVE